MDASKGVLLSLFYQNFVTGDNHPYCWEPFIVTDSSE